MCAATMMKECARVLVLGLACLVAKPCVGMAGVNIVTPSPAQLRYQSTDFIALIVRATQSATAIIRFRYHFTPWSFTPLAVTIGADAQRRGHWSATG